MADSYISWEGARRDVERSARLAASVTGRDGKPLIQTIHAHAHLEPCNERCYTIPEPKPYIETI